MHKPNVVYGNIKSVRPSENHPNSTPPFHACVPVVLVSIRCVLNVQCSDYSYLSTIVVLNTAIDGVSRPFHGSLYIYKIRGRPGRRGPSKIPKKITDLFHDGVSFSSPSSCGFYGTIGLPHAGQVRNGPRIEPKSLSGSLAIECQIFGSLEEICKRRGNGMGLESLSLRTVCLTYQSSTPTVAPWGYHLWPQVCRISCALP